MRYTALLLVTAIAIVVFGVTMLRAVWYAPQEDTIALPAQQVPLVASSTQVSLPVRLKIPSLSIDAHVQHVGVAKSGNMAVPSNFTDVGWYKNGTVPGTVGSAVIDGHVDNGLALAGVFKHLSELKKGDDIYVETASSTELHFVVESVALYPYKEVPTDLLFSQNDKARLNLITCDGTWVQGEKTYDHRLVVYAVLP